MPLNPLKNHYAMENPASIYDEEALTALELAGRTTAKVNETVEAFNVLESETMPAEVKKEVLSHIHNGDFDQAINTYMGDLNGRLDNILENPGGSGTTLDAEIVDARYKVGGEVAPNLGASIRQQVTDCYNRIGLVPLGAWGNGFIQPNGSVQEQDDWKCTDFLPVMLSATYHVRTALSEYACVAWYDKAKKKIATFQVNGTTPELKTHLLATPEYAKYIRISCHKNHTASAELRVYNVTTQLTKTTTELAELATIEVKPVNITADHYLNKNGVYSVYKDTGRCFHYDVRGLRGQQVTHTAVTADAGYHCFFNNGYFIGATQANTFVIPENATELILSNLSHLSPHNNVALYAPLHAVVKNIESKGATQPMVDYSYGIGRIFAIGDSLTSGAYYPAPFNGDSINENYPYYLGKMVNQTFTNGGYSGITAKGWADKYLNNFTFMNCDTVIIWLGTNYGLEDTIGQNLDDNTGGYERLLTKIQTNNPDAFIVLCNIFTCGWGDLALTNNVIAQLAEKYGCLLVDMTKLGLKTMPELHAGVENIHFGKAGNIYIAHHIKNAINEYFNADPVKLEFGLNPRTN